MNCPIKQEERAFTDRAAHAKENTDDQEILPGAKISDNVLFKDRLDNEVKLTPVMVEFRRLIQSGDTVDVIHGVKLTYYPVPIQRDM